MIHAREDYNRIQDPAQEHPSLLSPGRTPIAADEPVILFRAQDRHMPYILQAYRAMLSEDYKQTGNPETLRVIQCIEQHLLCVCDWQRTHGCKDPDL